MNSRSLPALAAFGAFVAVALGAAGSHMLKDPEAKGWVSTATSYLLLHAIAVFALMAWKDTPLGRLCAWLLLAGAALFSGSLYALAFGASHQVAIVAPVGGTLLMLGWAFAVVNAFGR